MNAQAGHGDGMRGRVLLRAVVNPFWRPLHRPHPAGYNVCIFAYGQTGSGKVRLLWWRAGCSGPNLQHVAMPAELQHALPGLRAAAPPRSHREAPYCPTPGLSPARTLPRPAPARRRTP